MHISKPWCYLLFLFFTIYLLINFFFSFTKQTSGAPLQSAKAQLGNSRLSFYAYPNQEYPAGTEQITIDTASPSNDTANLLPNDTIIVNNTKNTVKKIIDSQTFTVTTPLPFSIGVDTLLYSAQTSSLSLFFDIVNPIPANGYLKIVIPDSINNTNDGIPDTTDSLTTNGFDLNNLTESNISIITEDNCQFDGAGNLTAGSGAGHSYTKITNSGCSKGKITIIFSSDPGFINPAPINSHVAKNIDSYSILIETYNPQNQLIDEINTKVGTNEGVKVSAQIESTLSLKVEGVSSKTQTCGQMTNITTTAETVPFGTLVTPSGFKNAAQRVSIAGFAQGGYELKLYEDNELTQKEGFFIPDTSCDNNCTHQKSTEWNVSNNYGLGYSLERLIGEDISFNYNEQRRIFSAKQFPNKAHDEFQLNDPGAQLMQSTNSTINSTAYICFRLSLPLRQEAGNYYNQITYVAVPKF